MKLEEALKRLDTSVVEGDIHVSVELDRIEQDFSAKNRMLTVYSKVKYGTKNFDWEAVLPTVRIPYKDPALGFLVDGLVFSSVGVYQRAPGVVASVEQKVVGSTVVEEPTVDIITAHNTTITIGTRRSGIQIVFKRGGTERRVSMGVFLKALSGLPYRVILDKFAYKPQALINSFPCEVPDTKQDLSKTRTFGIESNEEPTIDACIQSVYRAITQGDVDKTQTTYSAHWQMNRINAFLNSLHFKTEQNYEAKLSVGNRAVGTYLDTDINLPIFDKDGKVTAFTLPAGHFITDDDAKEIRRYNLPILRVRLDRSFVLQEETPMLFRAKGYQIANGIASLHLNAGSFIDDETLLKINKEEIYHLEVITPNGRKVLNRLDSSVGIGDFYTILNFLFTNGFQHKEDSTQYEVGNRIIQDYDRQIIMEVEQVYSNIITSIVGSTALPNLLQSLPSLPSNKLKEYLGDSRHKEVSQSDLTNIMSRAISDTKASALMRSAPMAMTEIQKGQYGRLDALHSPDSDKVGSVQQRTVLSRVNGETGEVEAPYEKVVDGKPTGTIVHITGSKENNKYIVAWDNDLSSDMVLARYNGDVTTVARERVDYRDASPYCDMSVSRMTIPFPEFSQPKRSLMATKMNGQAVPLLFPERALVGTGADTEVPCLYYTARQVLQNANIPIKEGHSLEIVNAKWETNTVSYTLIHNGQSFTFDLPFTCTDKESLYNYNLNLNGGSTYNLDDVMFYNQSCDLKQYELWERMEQGALPLVKDASRPAMALGVNLRVCYKTYGAATVDDAVLISDRLISDNTLTSVQVFKYQYALSRDEQFKDFEGTALLHSHVSASEPVISVLRSRASGYVTKTIKAKQAGEVVRSDIEDVKGVPTATVWVSTYHHAEVGDKVAGRYGNKSVIAKIVPAAEMLYDPETGDTIDICCSPLGIPSRMNLGQVLEMTLGAVMFAQHKVAVVSPFYPNIKDDILKEYSDAGLSPKRLYNPVYGKFTDRPVMVGNMYFMKLEQMSNLKISAVGYPTAVDPVFGQPTESTNTNKGQAIGEMESWALIASGAKTMLNSFYSFYADDEKARSTYFEMLRQNKDGDEDYWDESEAGLLTTPVDNKNALVTQTVFRMFGQDVDVVDNKYNIMPLDFNDIAIEVTPTQLKNHSEVAKDTEWSKVKLLSPIVNPFWVDNFPLRLVLGIKSVTALVKQMHYLDVFTGEIVPKGQLTKEELISKITGVEALVALLKNTTIDQAIENLISSTQGSDDITMEPDMEDEDYVFRGEVLEETANADVVPDAEDAGSFKVPMHVADVLKFLRRLKSKGYGMDIFIWNYLPVMPKIFRQSNLVNGTEREHSFQKQIRHICEASASQDIYKGVRELLGSGEKSKENLESIRGFFFGRGSQAGTHGKVRSAVLSKRVGFSGRTVIVPAQDIRMQPMFIGLPWRTVMVELGKVLSYRLRNRAEKLADTLREKPVIADGSVITAGKVLNLEYTDWQEIIESLGEFNEYLLGKHFPGVNSNDLLFIYNELRRIVRQLVEGNVREDGAVWYKGKWEFPEDLDDNATIDAAVASVGRQPTLHKKSHRVFFVRLVDGYCKQIHHMVCESYNADFDGDTMWDVQLLGDSKVEGLKHASIFQDLISEKDGSYTLALIQDVALGIYCATTFKDNAASFTGKRGEYYYFNDLDALRMELEYGDLKYTDAVCFENTLTHSKYFSTAGRVLVNGLVPGAFTLMPFTDTDGICASALGEEFVSQFKELKYDMVWTTTGARPEGRTRAVKISNVLLDIYSAYTARASVTLAQNLYEVGLVASDICSISFTTDDMSVTTDINQFMVKPRVRVEQLNSLYQMGLISEDERKMASIHAWEGAKKLAQKEIIKALDPQSNTYYMMYSGARGKPDQVMQAVGFIGTISKTKDTDIEYPILHGYGNGLSSMDLQQASYSARIGVVSAQAGTKDTGYATRQSVYMTSGLCISEDDCSITNHVVSVPYDGEDFVVVNSAGETRNFEDLQGEFVSSDTEGFDILRKELTRSSYMVNDKILSLIVEHGLHSLTTLDTVYTFTYRIRQDWRARALEDLYSYALPYTDGFKATKESVDWIEEHGLTSVIGFDCDDANSKQCFDKEPYLPVDYDTSKYSVYYAGVEMGEENLYAKAVSKETEGFRYFKNLITSEGRLTTKAVNYLTKKKVHTITFDDGTVATIRYKLSDLFKNITVGRVSVGLPYLDDESTITQKTLKEIEDLQLEYIPVRTSLTCLSEGGICAACYGKALSAKGFLPVGENLGIAASQAMCQPLSQATLNVTHSGGNRGSGVGLISGLKYYTRMLQGTMTTERTASMTERFAGHAGYVRQNKHNKNFIQIISDEGTVEEELLLKDVGALNVPDGAYVEVNDTLVAGLPRLDRFKGTDVFAAALRTRYLLLKEYHKVFAALEVSARNYEVMARAQTSNCYLVQGERSEKIRDTGVESKYPTGLYELVVSTQAQTVSRFTGLAGYAFEYVTAMIASDLMTPEGLPLNSALSNLITGTPVGSTEAKFIPKQGMDNGTPYKKSRVKEYLEQIEINNGNGASSNALKLGTGAAQTACSDDIERELLSKLFGAEESQPALPETQVPQLGAMLMDLEAVDAETPDLFQEDAITVPFVIVEETEAEPEDYETEQQVEEEPSVSEEEPKRRGHTSPRKMDLS